MAKTGVRIHGVTLCYQKVWTSAEVESRSCGQRRPMPVLLALGQMTLYSVEIQVTGKGRTGHFNQMTITNSGRAFMSWICEQASGKLLVQMQTENTCIRIASEP